MKKIFLLIPFLTACDLSVPFNVSGQFEDGLQFTGMANTKIGGLPTGGVKLQASNGLRCAGNYEYYTRHKGTGQVICSNGQKGQFELNADNSGMSGTFEGDLEGRKFKGYF